MTRLTCVLITTLAFAAFGCKKQGGDCGAAIAHSMGLAKADMQKRGADDKMLDKMKDIATKHCTEDKWSEEALACMNDAKTEQDAQACYGKLSSEQQGKMNKAAKEEMTPPTPPSQPPTPPTGATGGGPEGAASGAGSADTTGSAAPPK